MKFFTEIKKNKGSIYNGNEKNKEIINAEKKFYDSFINLLIKKKLLNKDFQKKEHSKFDENITSLAIDSTNRHTMALATKLALRVKTYEEHLHQPEARSQYILFLDTLTTIIQHPGTSSLATRQENYHKKNHTIVGNHSNDNNSKLKKTVLGFAATGIALAAIGLSALAYFPLLTCILVPIGVVAAITAGIYYLIANNDCDHAETIRNNENEIFKELNMIHQPHQLERNEEEGYFAGALSIS